MGLEEEEEEDSFGYPEFVIPIDMETKITYEVKAKGKHLTLIIIPLIENDDSEEIPQSVYSEK